MRDYLERQELNASSSFTDPCADMEPDEMRRYVRFLLGQLEEKQEQMNRVLDDLSELKAASKEQSKLLERVMALTDELDELRKRNAELVRSNKKLEDRLGVVNNDHYNTSKSRKGIDKDKGVKGRNDDRSDFDGTVPTTPTDTGSVDTSAPVYSGASRKGTTYKKDIVGDPIEHKCDRSKLPAGTVILKVMKSKVVRTVVNLIEEHHFEVLKVKYLDGSIKHVYLPCDDDNQAHLYNEVVSGTHITASLLFYLLFNRYQMCSPDYRESKNRLSDMDWNTCRQNLANWADKGAVQLNKLIPALKSIALEPGSNVNVDETWCRYQTHFGHKKTYMWCLVNKKACIVIFFYEDCLDELGTKHEGGRGRSVLKDFLGDAQIKSLQSDGYNVYMYLDDELMEVEHLCCLAHARNKFKDAYNQGCEKARFFLEQIAKLYKREDDYRRDKLAATRIQEKRNDIYTNGIVNALRSELYDLLALPEEEKSDLMRTALNYLHKFWEQLFAYRKDGEYTIDNLAAERAIRPLTVQRKNSLFFCSTKGALRSAVYNTFIETCKQAGISFRSFFCKYMTEIRKGRTDYENLLPMTISLTN
ncbi:MULTISPECIES: IS66 family transposase [Bacteroides]|nr:MULTISPECIES: IS66 family transposase [Bacteroides]MCS2660611.1 IS66 family transposase [Bacteroides fragilis]MCY6337447.1 IS66 family transposase [Bacteroides fragilis]MCZ2540610.1 IS66 family transposase [Bacteroides fragilis]MDK2387737.1 IS66 family transposase [Bacteroides fragilis]MDK2391525.1 IS66 family transposase [Bacteroides fragilis]